MKGLLASPAKDLLSGAHGLSLCGRVRDLRVRVGNCPLVGARPFIDANAATDYVLRALARWMDPSE